MGRLTRDPDVRYSQNNGDSMAIARYTLAVDRRFSRGSNNGEGQNADFISCVAFGKAGEFAEKYFHKGIKIAVTGRIQTGSYEKDGQKRYTTDVVANNVEFLTPRNEGGQGFGQMDQSMPQMQAPASEFQTQPDSGMSGGEQDLPAGFQSLDDDDIPF